MTELIRTKLEKKQEWEDEWTEKYINHCFWKEAFSHDVDVLLELSYPTVSTFFIPLLQCCIGFTVCWEQIITKICSAFKRLKQHGRSKYTWVETRPFCSLPAFWFTMAWQHMLKCYLEILREKKHSGTSTFLTLASNL